MKTSSYQRHFDIVHSTINCFRQKSYQLFIRCVIFSSKYYIKIRLSARLTQSQMDCGGDRRGKTKVKEVDDGPVHCNLEVPYRYIPPSLPSIFSLFPPLSLLCVFSVILFS